MKKSKEVIKGQVSEQIIPLLPNFPYLLSQLSFVGKPIDYIVFPSNNLGDDEIIIAEVKSGGAELSLGQRRIKKIVEQGKVRFETWRVMDDGTIKIS